MVYTGKKNTIFWGWETSFKSGIKAPHCPFNPCESIEELPVPIYGIQEINVLDKLEPKDKVSTTKEAQEKSLEMIFMDPLLMLNIFDYIYDDGTWTGASESLKADFYDAYTGTNISDKKSLWMRFDKIEINETTPVNIQRVLKGGRITNYKLSAKIGEMIRESVSIKFADSVVDTTACNIDAGFDDASWDSYTHVTSGGWSEWDANGGPFYGEDVTVTFDNGTVSLLADFKITGMDLEISTPVDFLTMLNEKVASKTVDGKRDFRVILTGYMIGDDLLIELETDPNNRVVDADFEVKIAHDEGGASESVHKFIITNAFIESVSPIGLKAAGGLQEVSIVIAPKNSSVLKYEGIFDETDDPTVLISDGR